ncbi:MAG: preprotein translocase subunit SecG, partial [Candidatus Nanopelagicales bacterium]
MSSVLVVGLAILLVITSVLLIVLILLHRGKGGGLSDLFGGGVTSSVGGSSVAEKNLNRITVALGLVWAASIVAVGLLVRT